MAGVAATKIATIVARAVNVPMRRPLATGGGMVGSAALTLVDVTTADGLKGSSYIFCYAPYALKAMVELVQSIGGLIVGDPLAPAALEQKLQRRMLLIGPQGLVAMALAGIDQACWDAYAKSLGLPLLQALGGSPRPLPAYNSCGLGLIGAKKAAKEAVALLDRGFTALKVRLGYATLEEDLAVVRAVRKAVPAGTVVMSDYNQCLLPAEAIRRGRALDDEGLYWIEEPVRFDDFAGNAAVAAALRTAVQNGENFWGPHDLQKAIEAKAMDYVMPDAIKIGGVSGWLRAAALCEAQSLPVSSHLFPEVSAHLLAVTPTAHYLEYVDWAEPILRQPVRIEKGAVLPSSAAGNGITWDEKAVAKYAA